jgi:hypothetical protein
MMNWIGFQLETTDSDSTMIVPWPKAAENSEAHHDVVIHH